ncbi:MAG: ABC transporter ATP-binding protein [Planctomycetes bacterium]|nr:ABC transporter ATP-binding protein [Planctomycetota bacterium]
MSDSQAILSAKELRFGYPGRAQFMGPLSFDVQAGQVWGILGPNGAGKSTLLRLCVGLAKPTGGRALLRGREVWGVRANDRARMIAFLPQRPEESPEATVREIVLLGRYPYRRYRLFESPDDVRIAEAALRQTEMLSFADRPIGTLSGGEAQRVYLAAALAQQPDVLVLDEPTASLDPYHQLQIFSILGSLAADRNLAIVVATHDLNLAGRFCHRLLLLSEGKQAASGPPEVALDPQLLERVYRVRFQMVAGVDGDPGWVLPVAALVPPAPSPEADR